MACTSLKNHVSSLVWLNRAELFWQSSCWKPLHVFPWSRWGYLTVFPYVLSHAEISRETTLTGFYMDQMGTKLVHPHSTSKCFLLFKSQNPAVWQQTAQKSNSSVLSSWKIPSLPAGKNQPLPDHLIAFEIINWILYYSSPVFFHCGF